MGYYEKCGDRHLAVLDLTDYYGHGKIINRINVPEKFRRQGIGNRLLKQAIADADKNRYTLWLEINPYGEMTYAQLEAWYMRNGFKKWMGLYRRKPQAS